MLVKQNVHEIIVAMVGNLRVFRDEQWVHNDWLLLAGSGWASEADARAPTTAICPVSGRAKTPLSSARDKRVNNMGKRAGRGALLFLHRALQRMLVALRKVHHLRHFRFGDFMAVDTNDGDAFLMHRQH